MQMFSRRTALLDALVVLGLALIGVSVYLWQGVPAVLAYAGTVLIAVALVLAAQAETGAEP